MPTELNNAIWVAQALFTRNKASGSSANLSFKTDEHIYITGSGTCFGTLTEDDFSILNLQGEWISGIKPSKELPLHLMMYAKEENIRAVVHTHSFYSTLWSCLEHEKPFDCVPQYTPYLEMKVGSIGLVPYAKPGSEALFQAFSQVIPKSNGFLLGNHGPIVGGKSIHEAFYNLEELEESCRVAWEFEGKSKQVSAIKK